MDSLGTELRILASLLGTPDLDAKEAVLELAAHYEWLEPAAKELEAMPLDEWQAEHKRLFISGCPTAPCPLYESAYLGGRMRNHQNHSLKSLYSRMGMMPADTPPDHLGTMLECASLINTDPEVGKTYWPELWNGHLARWVPRFCSRLKAESRIKLYRVLAERLCVLFPEVEQAVSNVA